MFFRTPSLKFSDMKSAIPSLLFLTLISCNTDHKKETISTYVRYIWKINSDNRLELRTLEETGTIRGKDSLEILVRQFSQGEKTIPSADSLIADYEKDELYNSNLLEKTKVKIDSFKKINQGDNSFYVEYVKSLEQLKEFTNGQIAELRAEKNLLKKYKSDPDEILCHRVRCLYKIKKETPDTTSKVITQVFYLSKDTKRVLVVK